jgi:hypothetical protein
MTEKGCGGLWKTTEDCKVEPSRAKSSQVKPSQAKPIRQFFITPYSKKLKFELFGISTKFHP